MDAFPNENAERKKCTTSEQMFSPRPQIDLNKLFFIVQTADITIIPVWCQTKRRYLCFVAGLRKHTDRSACRGLHWQDCFLLALYRRRQQSHKDAYGACIKPGSMSRDICHVQRDVVRESLGITIICLYCYRRFNELTTDLNGKPRLAYMR